MNNNQIGISFPAVLFIVFLILKLCDVIDWSWWWVTAPLWVGAVFAVLLTIIAIVVSRVRI